MSRVTHIIDATGKPVGRIATEVAGFLRGKQKATYTPHIDDGDIVKVVNVSQMSWSGKKIEQKALRHHTTHPGGIKVRPVKDIMKHRPEEVLEHAVLFMLPKNRTRKHLMKRLTIVK
ncbi:MAG: rplM [Candidatus Magasanikbacteria bacterium]|nr:rplM [Candidatus Magasanikbacteria bacterium]